MEVALTQIPKYANEETKVDPEKVAAALEDLAKTKFEPITKHGWD